VSRLAQTLRGSRRGFRLRARAPPIRPPNIRTTPLRMPHVCGFYFFLLLSFFFFFGVYRIFCVNSSITYENWTAAQSVPTLTKAGVRNGASARENSTNKREKRRLGSCPTTPKITDPGPGRSRERVTLYSDEQVSVARPSVGDPLPPKADTPGTTQDTPAGGRADVYGHGRADVCGHLVRLAARVHYVASRPHCPHLTAPSTPQRVHTFTSQCVHIGSHTQSTRTTTHPQ